MSKPDVQSFAGDMQGRVALVTGGAGHIGRATARELARRGCQIGVIDKSAGATEDCAAELRASFGVKAEAIVADLSDEAAFAAIHERAMDAFQRVDFLVNNAAFYDSVPGWGVPFAEEGYEAWLKVMRVNLLAPFFLAQALAPSLKSAKGAVVNVSSIYGLVGPDHGLYKGLNMNNPAAYSASKGGLLSLTRWLSTVLAPDVRVNAVAPGGVARGQPREFVDRYEARTPLGRMASEGDAASSIAFLLSDAAAYVTGQCLAVDGGWTAW